MLLVTFQGKRYLVARDDFDAFFDAVAAEGASCLVHEIIPIWQPEPKEHKK